MESFLLENFDKLRGMNIETCFIVSLQTQAIMARMNLYDNICETVKKFTHHHVTDASKCFKLIVTAFEMI